jgi:hypothetical protein
VEVEVKISKGLYYFFFKSFDSKFFREDNEPLRKNIAGKGSK